MIINPMWFYWLRVIDNLHILCEVVCIVGIIFGAITFVVGIVYINDSYSQTDSDYIIGKKLFRAAIVILIVVIIFGLSYLFVPDKTTMIEMQVAKNLTVDNIEWTKETFKESVDYIIEKIGEING